MYSESDIQTEDGEIGGPVPVQGRRGVAECLMGGQRRRRAQVVWNEEREGDGESLLYRVCVVCR